MRGTPRTVRILKLVPQVQRGRERGTDWRGTTTRAWTPARLEGGGAGVGHRQRQARDDMRLQNVATPDFDFIFLVPCSSCVDLRDDVIGFVERCGRNSCVLRALIVRVPLKTLPGNELPTPTSIVIIMYPQIDVISVRCSRNRMLNIEEEWERGMLP